MTDKELLEQVAEKDAAAFRELYFRYQKLLAEWAYSRLKDWDVTADLMQDFWAEVWLDPRIIRTDDAGMCRNSLLKNVSFRILRSFRKQLHCPEIADDEVIAAQVAQLSYTHIDEEISAKEIQQFIDQLLEKVPLLAKRIVELRLYRNLSVKDTALTLGVAESTVSNNLSSVLATLRQELTLRHETAGAEKLKTILPFLLLLLGE